VSKNLYNAAVWEPDTYKSITLNYETVVSATDLLAIVKENMTTACAHLHLLFKGEWMPLLNCLWTHLQVPSGDSSWLIAVICCFLDFFSFNFNSSFTYFWSGFHGFSGWKKLANTLPTGSRSSTHNLLTMYAQHKFLIINPS
jgi:hypothetical protein